MDEFIRLGITMQRCEKPRAPAFGFLSCVVWTHALAPFEPLIGTYRRETPFRHGAPKELLLGAAGREGSSSSTPLLMRDGGFGFTEGLARRLYSAIGEECDSGGCAA